jgi:hypothetical protein
MSEFLPPVACACGETRTRKEDMFVLTQAQGRTAPAYSNTKFVCIGCGKARFETRLQ